MELVDQAEQLEAAARVTEAERRLTALRGDDEALKRTVDELLARERAHAAADARAREIQVSRLRRIDEILKPFQIDLFTNGWDVLSIEYALGTAHAVLTALPDFVLGGNAYPVWRAACAIADGLRLDRPAPPVLLITVVDASGTAVPSWRTVQLGD